MGNFCGEAVGKGGERYHRNEEYGRMSGYGRSSRRMGEVVGERRRKKINGSKEGDDFWKGKGGISRRNTVGEGCCQADGHCSSLISWRGPRGAAARVGRRTRCTARARGACGQPVVKQRARRWHASAEYQTLRLGAVYITGITWCVHHQDHMIQVTHWATCQTI